MLCIEIPLKNKTLQANKFFHALTSFEILVYFAFITCLLLE